MLPVETQATRFMPSRTAWATPQVMPLSLNDPVGLKPWCLKVTASSPAHEPLSGGSSRGVLPSRSVTICVGSSRRR